MSQARQAILQRLRTHGPVPVPEINSRWQTPAFSADEGAAQFIQALRLAHAEVIETNEADWANELARLAVERGWHNWLCGHGSPVASGFQAAAHAARLNCQAYDRPIEDFKSELFHHIDAGLTQAQAGIAATGSLLVIPDHREPRLLSLVPPVHAIVVRRSTLVDHFDELVRQQDWARKGMPTNALLISGPSKTADIQQTLAYGAHGPKELIVLFIHD